MADAANVTFATVTFTVFETAGQPGAFLVILIISASFPVLTLFKLVTVTLLPALLESVILALVVLQVKLPPDCPANSDTVIVTLPLLTLITRQGASI